MEFDAAVRLFDKYLEGELTDVQKKALEDLLERDERCKAELDRYRGVHDVVEQYFTSVRPEEGFLEDVMVGVEEAEAPKKRRRSRTGGATSAGAGSSDSGGGRPWLAVVAVVVLAGAAFAGFRIFFGSDSAVGEVLDFARSAERSRDGSGIEALDRGARLFAGDSVRANGGSVQLLLDVPGEVTLATGGHLRVGGSAGRHEVLGGAVRFVVREDHPDFEVLFDAGRAQVQALDGGEARFEVRVPEGEAATEVEVTKGTVEVSTDRGERVVAAGMKSNLRRNAAPSNPVSAKALMPADPRRDRRTGRDSGRTAGGRTAGRDSNRNKPNDRRPADAGRAKPTVSLEDRLASLRDLGTDRAGRLEALRALAPAFVGDRKAEVRVLLLDILRRDPETEVRAEAFARLQAFGTPELYDDATAVLQEDADLGVRRKALAVVAARGKDSDPVVRSDVSRVLSDTLSQLYDEDLLPLRADLLDALGKIGDPDSLGSVQQVAESGDDVAIREAAIKAMAGFKTPATIDGLISLLRDEESVVRAAATASLRRITGQSSFGFDPDADEDVRSQAIERVEIWWADNRDTFEF